MNIILSSHLAAGDTLMMTSAVRELKKQYPQYKIGVDTSCSEIWDNNPYVTFKNWTKIRVDNEWKYHSSEHFIHIPLGYDDCINQSGQNTKHFVYGYLDELSDKLNLKLKLTKGTGDLFLTEEEKKPIIDEPYWIIIAGGKRDFSTKHYPHDYYQQIVNNINVKWVQCGELGDNHWHIPLENVDCRLGQTTLRQFISLIYNASGVVCPVTFAMHCSAAFQDEKLIPTFVLAGGRESNTFTQYKGHQFFHTIGQFPCCKTDGCWKAKVTWYEANKTNLGDFCQLPVEHKPGIHYAKCMVSIKPEEVITQIRKYL